MDLSKQNNKIHTVLLTGLTSAAIAALIISLVSSTSHASSSSSSQTTNNYKGVKREFWLFNDHVAGLNDTKVGLSADKFRLSSIVAKKGDTVVIHFYNTKEKGGDAHSFTIHEKPYNNINTIVAPGTNQTITFTATNAGVFTYLCTFHPPSMRGQLIVEPPTQDDVAEQQQ